MICFPLSKSPVGLARFGAHRCPPTSPFMVPRSQLRDEQASLEAREPACPPLALRCLPLPPPLSPACVCFVSAFVSRQQRRGQSVCRSHPPRPVLHLSICMPPPPDALHLLPGLQPPRQVQLPSLSLLLRRERQEAHAAAASTAAESSPPGLPPHLSWEFRFQMLAGRRAGGGGREGGRRT